MASVMLGNVRGQSPCPAVFAVRRSRRAASTPARLAVRATLDVPAPNGVKNGQRPPISTAEALRIQEAQLQKQLDAIRFAIRKEEMSAKERSSAEYDDVDVNYSFYARTAGLYIPGDAKKPDDIGATPLSVFALASRNFAKELNSLIEDLQSGGKGFDMTPKQEAIKAKIDKLTLSNQAIWDREHKRPEIKAPWIIKAPYLVLCLALDNLFDGKPIARFWFLETVARMPYFSYITMLHTYETLGWWRVGAAVKHVHFAEEFNEFNHLMIMESLGGDRDWRTRFFANHAAIIYYFVLIILWLCSPTIAYNFSELIEAHAVDTYGQFVDENEEILKSLPAPRVAKAYYNSPNLYMFDEFQTSREPGSRRPDANTLYDVFCNIRDDEGEHVKTMSACQDSKTIVNSPNTEAAIVLATAAAAAASAVAENVGLTIGLSAATREIVAEGVEAAAEVLSGVMDELVANGGGGLL